MAEWVDVERAFVQNRSFAEATKGAGWRWRSSTTTLLG
jgi:hypothetical protein